MADIGVTGAPEPEDEGEEDKLEPIFEGLEFPEPTGPPLKWISVELVRKTTENFATVEEEHAIEVLLTCMNARSEEELEAARALVRRANSECESRGFPDDWLTCMTGLVARDMDLTMEARTRFEADLDSVSEKVEKLWNEHLPTIPPEAEDPEQLWWLMPPANYFKAEKYWPKWVKTPRQRHFKVRENAPELDLAEIARQCGMPNPELFQTKRDFMKGAELDAAIAAIDKEIADNTAADNKGKGKDDSAKATTKAVVDDDDEKKTTTDKTKEVPSSQQQQQQQQHPPSRLGGPHHPDKRRKVVMLDEAPAKKTDEKKKKKKVLTLRDVFGEKLNVVESDAASRQILESFVAKKPPPEKPVRVKIHEETTAQDGTSVVTTLFVLLDWAKYSFKKTRTQKKIKPKAAPAAPAPAPAMQEENAAPPPPPAGVPELALMQDAPESPPPPKPAPPPAGVPELALMQDSPESAPDDDSGVPELARLQNAPDVD